jgi:phosphopantetheinyl transferase
MALLLHEQIQPEGDLGLWQIEESEEWFLEQLELKEAELAQLARLKGRRRSEWLAARQLVHQMSGRAQRGAFWKDEFGKPHLEGSPYEISISHSHSMAAAIAAPQAVGIDIQLLVPKLERLAKKFMNPSELDSIKDGPERLAHLHVYWGAKESLYKAYGRRALDFCQNIFVQPFAYQAHQGRLEGWINTKAGKQSFQLRYEKKASYMLVYAVAL